MKALVRYGLALGLSGGILFASPLGGNKPAMALTEAEVMKRLEVVPVFTITNDQGAPILQSTQDEKKQIASFFISPKDAQSVIERIKSQNPEIGKAAQLRSGSLSQFFKLVKENQQKPNQLAFELLPAQNQVSLALSVLQQSGEKVSEFRGIPVFYAAGEDKTPLSFEANGKQAVLVFFNKEDLQAVLEQIGKQNPEQANKAKVAVSSLDRVVGIMLEDKSSAASLIDFVPSRESIEYLRSISPASRQPRPTLPPASRPQSTP